VVLIRQESRLQHIDDASASLEVYRGQGRPPGRFGGQPWTSEPPRSRTAWPYGPYRQGLPPYANAIEATSHRDH